MAIVFKIRFWYKSAVVYQIILLDVPLW